MASSSTTTTPIIPIFNNVNNLNFDNEDNTTATTTNMTDMLDTDIHIRIKQRNGKKMITTIEGIHNHSIDMKKILKIFKTKFACGGCIITDEETASEVLQFSGDQRSNIFEYFTKNNMVKATHIQIHG